MTHVKARTIGWIAIYLAILPLFMIPEIVWASRVKALDSGMATTEVHLAFSAKDAD